MTKTNFWFATFEIEGITGDVTDFDPSQSRDDLIRERINEYVRSNEAVYESATGEWYFGSLDDRGDTLLGQFGKEYTDNTSEYDDAKGVFVDDAGSSTDAQYSFFVLHFPLNLLVYNTRNRVGKNQFPRNFSNGYNQRYNSTISIKPLKNRDDIETVISEYRVYEADFNLTPSNPHPGPTWESLDDSIQEMLANSLGIEAEALEGSGLNFDEELLHQVKEMAKSDYGDYELHYDQEGYLKKITSGDGDVIVQRKPEPDGLGGLADLSTQFINYAATFLE